MKHAYCVPGAIHKIHTVQYCTLSVREVFYIKYTYCASDVLQQDNISSFPQCSWATHCNQAGDPRDSRRDNTYLKEEQTEAQRRQASSLSCWAGRNLFALSPSLSLSPLLCCSTPIYKGQCSVNLGTFIVVESQAIWWPLWGDILRSVYHHIDGSYNHIQNAPPSGSPMDIPSPPGPLLILSRIALRCGLRQTENLKDGTPRGASVPCIPPQQNGNNNKPLCLKE